MHDDLRKAYQNIAVECSLLDTPCPCGRYSKHGGIWRYVYWEKRAARNAYYRGPVSAREEDSFVEVVMQSALRRATRRHPCKESREPIQGRHQQTLTTPKHQEGRQSTEELDSQPKYLYSYVVMPGEVSRSVARTRFCFSAKTPRGVGAARL